MSGENRRSGFWMLPVIVVAVGIFFLVTGFQSGTLRPAQLRPVNWAGLAVAAAGLIAALAAKKPLVKLAGVLLCGIGAILVICI